MRFLSLLKREILRPIDPFFNENAWYRVNDTTSKATVLKLNILIIVINLY